MRTIVALGVALLCSAPAEAAPFTWIIAGTITGVAPAGSTPFSGLLAVGDPFTLRLNMESSVPDFDPHPDCGRYAPITSMQFISGGVSESVATTPGQSFLVKSSGYSSSDACVSLVPPTANSGRIAASFGVGLGFSFDFFRLSPTDALPTSPVGITSTSLSLNYALTAPVGAGSITSITAVPEPATTALLGLGLAAAAGLRRRRSREVD